MNSRSALPQSSPASPDRPDGPDTLRSRVLSWRAFYWSVVVVLFAIGIFLRFHMAQQPFADPDTWGYLKPSLTKLNGGEFEHVNRRAFPYPGLLYLILASFRDFRAVSIIQHFLGLAAGGLLLACWMRARLLFSQTLRMPVRVYDGIGLLLLGIYLFNDFQILFEQQLRPEAVFAFFGMLTIWLGMEFMIRVWRRPAPLLAAALGGATLFSAMLLNLLKPSFGLAALFMCLPVLVSIVRAPACRVLLAGGAFAGFAASVLLLWWPEHVLKRSDPATDRFLPATLFVIHGNLIYEQIGEDLEAHLPIPYPRPWLEQVHTLLGREIAKSRELRPDAYKTLGFDPDYLMFHGTFCRQMRDDFANDPEGLKRFYFYYYARTAAHHPWQMLRKIVRELGVFYRWKNPSFDYRKKIDLGKLWARNAEIFDEPSKNPDLVGLPLGAAHLEAVTTLEESGQKLSESPFLLGALNSVLAGLFLPVLLLSLGGSILVLFNPRLRPRLLPLALVCVLLWSYIFANCLEIAVVHSLTIDRYTRILFTFTLLAEVYSLFFIVELCLNWFAQKETVFSGAKHLSPTSTHNPLFAGGGERAYQPGASGASLRRRFMHERGIVTRCSLFGSSLFRNEQSHQNARDKADPGGQEQQRGVGHHDRFE